MNRTEITVAVRHAGWPNQPVPTLTALDAYTSRTSGLAVLPGLPYFDASGELRHDAHPGIYSCATGERMSGRYSYLTVQDVLQRADRMQGVDWSAFPGLQHPADPGAYRQAFEAGWSA